MVRSCLLILRSGAGDGCWKSETDHSADMKATKLVRSLVLPILCVIAFQSLGQQIEADRKRFEEIKTKAENGDADAQFKLAWAYALGEGVASNNVEAAKWYRRAADQGHVKAQLNVAMDYSTGSGVPKDPTEAVNWWRKAAEQGDTTAQSFLGNAYYKGEGVEKDIAAAIELFRKAAELGGGEAQYRLGFCYATGNGVPLNTAEAYRWFQKAAKQSQFYTFGIFDIGEVYVKGKGVPADYLQGYKWYNLASALGNEFAAKARDILAAKMTPDQVAEAQRLTRDFIAGKSPESNSSAPRNEDTGAKPAISGTGFFYQ